MTTFPVTELSIKSLKPAKKQVDYYDTKIKRFGLRVSPTGTKAFFLWYRFQNKGKRLGLGRVGVVTLSDARKKALQALTDIANHTDPTLRYRAIPTDGKKTNFESYVDTFISKYAKRHTKSWSETDRLLKREFVSKWRKHSLASITKADLISVLDAIVERGSPSAANHAFAAVRKLFNWAVERGDLEISPVLNVKKPTKHVSRDRVLTLDELAKVWSAADHMGYPYGTIVQLLILTAQRRQEVAGMRWSELDLTQDIWTIDRDRNKSGRQHSVPLTPAVLKILQSENLRHCDLVFPGRNSASHVCGWSKWKRKLDELSGVTNWRLHDLRRTAATEMAKAKTPPHVVERILNHTTGTLGGVAGVYNQYGYLDEMRFALQQWDAEFGNSILNPIDRELDFELKNINSRIGATNQINMAT